MAAPGIEPGSTGLESVIFPLNYAAKIELIFNFVFETNLSTWDRTRTKWVTATCANHYTIERLGY